MTASPESLAKAIRDPSTGIADELAWVGEPSEFDGDVSLTVDGDLNVTRLLAWIDAQSKEPFLGTAQE